MSALRRHPCSEARPRRSRSRRRLRGGRQVAPRPRDGARGAERSASRNARHEEPRTRRGRPREAVAPEGDRSCACRDHARAALDGRRCRVRAGDAQLRGEGQPEGTAGGAPRRSQRPCLRRHVRTARRRVVRRPVDEAGGLAPRRVGEPDSDARRRHGGRGGAREVVPQPRARARDRSVGARGRIGRLGSIAPRDRSGPAARARSCGCAGCEAKEGSE